MKKKGVRLGTLFFLIVATAFVSCVGTYYYVSNTVNNLSHNQQMYQKLDILNQIVSNYYVLSVDIANGYDDIIDGISSGYVNGLGDEYSYYLNEKNYRTASVTSDSASVDIGIVPSYDKETGGIEVDFVRVGSSAKLAGMKKGDIILSVGGVNVTEDGYRRSVQRLSGQENSTVTLTVLRSGEPDIITVDIVRRRFQPQTVEYRLVQNNIGYIFINEFGDTTLEDFNAAYSDLSSKGAKGFVIDVRFNSSGKLDAAVGVVDVIKPAGTIVTVRAKDSSNTKSYFSDVKSITAPIVVIQNEHTNGVAEVFSAALQDMDTVTIVGTTTAGNGLAQTDISLSDGTAVRLSTAEYVTPSGVRFNGTGIVPDFRVNLDSSKADRFDELTDEEDDQLQSAVSQLKEMMGLA